MLQDSHSQPTSPDSTSQSEIETQFQQLVTKSVRTLETILEDTSVPASERATIALQAIALFKGTASPQIPALSPVNPVIQHAAPHTTSQTTPSKPSTTNPAPLHHFVCLDDFLSPEDNQKALDIALNQRQDFVASNTTTKAENYRQSSILYATYFADFYHFLRHKILGVVPQVLQQLQRPHFEVSQLEMQLTAHGDGCYYKVHNDSGSPNTATRELTYVYYVHGQPMGFSGGDLRLYETDAHTGKLIDRDRFTAVTPRNNRIVFFNSRCQHEVMPVECPSGRFEDYRITYNGWLRR